jgi:hypothetical protein
MRGWNGTTADTWAGAGRVPVDDPRGLPGLRPAEHHVRGGHLPALAVGADGRAAYAEVGGHVTGGPPLGVRVGRARHGLHLAIPVADPRAVVRVAVGVVSAGDDTGGMADARGDRAWLDVSYADKDAAKALGARWDPAERRWYAQPGRAHDLARWAAGPDLPLVLPGEDRTFGSGLFVDLVPRSCWFTNARAALVGADWERVRRMTLARASRRCEVCGAGEDKPAQRWLEVHERWHYDPDTVTQTLRRLILLCTDCHLATHLGYARVSGQEGRALAHLLAVRQETPAQLEAHVRAAEEAWLQRSDLAWHLNLDVLTAAGLAVLRP